MKKITFYVLGLLTLTMAGCATPEGPKFTSLPSVASGKANYVFIRSTEYEVKKITHPNIYIDGKDHGEYLYGGFTIVPVTPGKHDISIEGNRFNWDFDDLKAEHVAQEGETYFFELKLELAGYNRYRASFGSINKGSAMYKLKDLRQNQK